MRRENIVGKCVADFLLRFDSSRLVRIFLLQFLKILVFLILGLEVFVVIVVEAVVH